LPEQLLLEQLSLEQLLLEQLSLEQLLLEQLLLEQLSLEAQLFWLEEFMCGSSKMLTRRPTPAGCPGSFSS
jgi:hypothetical protein